MRAGVKLAKALGARVTGVYVALLYTAPVHSEGAIFYPGLSARHWRKCDAIAMASHRRGGLGSETTRVLAHSKIPVLVVR